MSTAIPLYTQSRRESRNAILWSLILHVAVILLLLIKLDWNSSDDIFAAAKVIDAVIVDSRVLDAPKIEAKKKQQALIQKQQREKKLAEQKKIQQQAEALRLAKQKEAEQQRRQLEQQKRLEAERLQQEQLRQERLQEEQRLLEQAQREEFARIKTEELAAAEQARSQELASQLGLYKAAIKQRVDRNWIRPLSVEDWYTCEVIVDQIPGGDVVNVEVLSCDGDAVFQRSIRNAVYKSSPLPSPPNPALFERKLKFTFRVPTE